MTDMSRIAARMQGQIVEMQRRQANMLRSGRVLDVDAAKQRVKVDIGDEGSPLETPWIRWTERAGARKTWNPPSPGELMTVLSPMGEIDGKSLAVHGGFTDDNAAPSGDGDAAVFTLGNLTITMIDGGARIEVGGISAEITGAGLAVIGGTVTHNGTDIGDTHKHTGITRGLDLTDTPA